MLKPLARNQYPNLGDDMLEQLVEQKAFELFIDVQSVA